MQTVCEPAWQLNDDWNLNRQGICGGLTQKRDSCFCFSQISQLWYTFEDATPLVKTFISSSLVMPCRECTCQHPGPSEFMQKPRPVPVVVANCPVLVPWRGCAAFMAWLCGAQHKPQIATRSAPQP